MFISCCSETVLSWLSFSGSVLSVLLGISHVIYGFTVLNFASNDCEFFYCNTSWRSLISFAPDTFFDTFQPILSGIVGMLYATPVGIRPDTPHFLAPPCSSLRGAGFHVVMALFCNLGYMSWVGIGVAVYNLLLGLTFAGILMFNRSQTRPKDASEIGRKFGSSEPISSGASHPIAAL